MIKNKFFTLDQLPNFYSLCFSFMNFSKSCFNEKLQCPFLFIFTSQHGHPTHCAGEVTLTNCYSWSVQSGVTGMSASSAICSRLHLHPVLRLQYFCLFLGHTFLSTGQILPDLSISVKSHVVLQAEDQQDTSTIGCFCLN